MAIVIKQDHINLLIYKYLLEAGKYQHFLEFISDIVW